MSSITASKHFADLASQSLELLSSLEKFQATLHSEAQALKATSHSEQLTSILESKTQLSEEITQLFQAFDTQLIKHQLSFSELLKDNIPPSIPSSITNTLQSIIQLSQQCHDLNQSNGISIQILKHLNQYTLNLISGHESPPVTLYSAKGKTQSSTTTPPPLGKA